MSDQVKQIAMRISDLREISDYTVERMAAALDVPVEEYKKIESGEIDIPISFLVKVGADIDKHRRAFPNLAGRARTRPDGRRDPQGRVRRAHRFRRGR